MQYLMPILPYAAVVLAVVGLVLGLSFLVSGASGADKNVGRRLTDLANSGKRQWSMSLRRKTLKTGKSNWLASILDSASIKSLDTLVSTSGVAMSTERLLFLIVVGFAAIFEGLTLFGHYNAVICGLVAALIAAVMPIAIIIRARRKRLSRILAQLPDATDMLVRSLLAGHPIPTGVGLVAREMPDPIGAEFARVYDDMAYGLDLRHAFEKMSQRLNIAEVNYMIAAMRIQSTSGGNLAEVLASLSNVIREKKKLRSKVKALSAEARFSGRILSAMPVFVVVMLLLMNPHYYDQAKIHESLRIILAGAATLMVVGILLVRKFVNIRI
jgi:tight adherence protein B